jgi:hypothetical protein
MAAPGGSVIFIPSVSAHPLASGWPLDEFVRSCAATLMIRGVEDGKLRDNEP